jgi:DNA-directed RNA polymerase subunit RPC12/RpoP
MIARRRYHCLRCERSVDGIYDPEAKADNTYHCAECGTLLNVDQQLKGYDPAFAESIFDDLGAPAEPEPKPEVDAARILGSLHLAADSWPELRRSDVYRVIEDAGDCGYAEEMASRIVGNRPDLEDEILACLDELA